jgi:ABC-type nitrate/sulfonate/bicarbonate transport system substrate-binding protein
LASEQVAGAVLVSPYDDKAVSKGFKKFMMIGDLLDIPTAGLVATRAEITNNRDRVQKTIAAVIDAIAWIRSNQPDTASMLADKFKITASEANATYGTLLSMLNKDGPDAAQSGAWLPGYSAPGKADTRRYRPAEVSGFFHAVGRKIAIRSHRPPSFSSAPGN